MQFQIDPQIFESLPSFKVGINYYNKITVSESPQMIQGRLQLFQEQLFFELEDQKVSTIKEIAEWRTLWKTFGADPNRHRPSIEALYRRIQKQNYLNSINSAVDLNNFFSLQYRIPMGIYNLDPIQSPIYLEIGGKDTAYVGLNGRENHLQNLLVLKDEVGPFGSPYVDGERTKVSENSHQAIQVFFLCPSMPLDEAQQLLLAAGNMFTSIHGGDFKHHLIHQKHPNATIEN